MSDNVPESRSVQIKTLSDKILANISCLLERVNTSVDEDGNKLKDYARSLSLCSQTLKDLIKYESSLQEDNDRDNFLNWNVSLISNHPYNLLSNWKMLPSLVDAMSCFNKGFKQVTLIGSRRSGKTYGIAPLFYAAIFYKYIQEIANGKYWLGWLNYKNRAKLDPFIECIVTAPSDDLTKKAKSLILEVPTRSGHIDVFDQEICSEKDGYWLRGGIRIKFKTGRNPLAIKSTGYHVVWIDEAVELPSNTWSEALIPAVSEKDGIVLASSTIVKGLTKEHFFLTDFIMPGLKQDHWGYDERYKRKTSITEVLWYKDNLFLSDEAMARMTQEVKRMPSFLYEQEIECDWRIKHDRVFHEAETKHRLQIETQEEWDKLISHLWGVWLAIDVGGGNAETAFIVIGADMDPQYPETNYIVLESYANAEYLLNETYWIELGQEIIKKYNKKFKWTIYDYGAEPEVRKWAKSVSCPASKLIRAQKDILPGIYFLKRCFEQEHLYIEEKNNERLFLDIGIEESNEHKGCYSWKRDSRTGERKNIPGDSWSDTMDALRYGVYTASLHKQLKKKGRH